MRIKIQKPDGTLRYANREFSDEEIENDSEATAIFIEKPDLKKVKKKPKLKLRGISNVIQRPDRPLYLDDYRMGGEGFTWWCEDFAYIPIYPEGEDIPIWIRMGELPSEPNPATGRSYITFWEEQKIVVRRALAMKDGRFLYSQIVLCWPRGDGKSFLACLIQLWKFFCWPKQTITLGANSKEQTKFVHYDIMRDIILNSPDLLEILGRRNVQEKEIRIMADGRPTSLIKPISTASGIVSNITGYTFSEIFDMKKDKFYVQLHGSIRNVPNAIGVIDSTVSAKDHVLYRLYTGSRSKKLEKTFFSYRFSKTGDHRDYWHPNMTTTQLEDYRYNFPFGEFERYFLNLWEAGKVEVFSKEMIQAMSIIALDNFTGLQSQIMDLLKEASKIEDQIDQMTEKGLTEGFDKKNAAVAHIKDRFTLIDKYMTLQTDPFSTIIMASVEDLEKLSDVYDTDWAIMIGNDRADPMKPMKRGARTIMTAVAKGLPGSRSNPPSFYDNKTRVPEYVYILVGLGHLTTDSLEEMKKFITDISDVFDGVDVVASERWGAWDLVPWCEEEGIRIDLYPPTWDKQRDAFSELFILMREGRFKAAEIKVAGSKGDNILKEELDMFEADRDEKWFGSPEKHERYGVQDDAIYSLAWCVFGGKDLSVNDFRPRRSQRFFGLFIKNDDVLGSYS